MAALADLINVRRARAILLAPSYAGKARRYPAKLLELSSQGVVSCASNSLVVGERIRIQIPALGALMARVTAADDREFRAEFCGPGDLRLLFLKKSLVGCSSWYERASD